MTDRAVITFAPPIFERDDLFILALLDDFRRDLCARNQWVAMGNVFAVGEHQYFAEGRGFAGIGIQKIDIDRVAFRDAILPSASLDDCVGHKLFSGEKKPRKFPQTATFSKQKVDRALRRSMLELGGGAAIN